MKHINAIESFCAATDTESDAVLGREKSLKIWNVRYMIWHYLHYNMGASANRIAKIFNRDRVNIFRGIRLIKHQMKYDSRLRETYYDICARIEGATDAAPSGDI